ncbi:floral homeotic protein PISTILLATA [Ricinus communis]|uniref:floral homeotic protein PISTILLATA n=1 Tax=Ricinus communis TaxID=3988 RepID=UPI00201AB53B|nr:floral homeotic protein PISTILLATA [Ricinus communis]
MGRGKLNMELISNEKSRMITYHKRKKGLTKKVQEFHILCDVDACIIIFSPKFNNRSFDIETWPSNRYEMRRIINRYRSQDNDRKRNQDLSHFFIARKKKIDEDIAKMRKAHMEAKYPAWDNRINLLQLHELSVLASVLQSKIEVATARVMKIRGESDHYFMVDSKSGIIHGGPISHNIRPNPMAATFANALVPKSLELEAFNNKQQPFYCTSQFDHPTSSHNQMLPALNVNNPTNSSTLMTMMMANGDDLNQFSGECSSERACSIIKDVTYFDPPTTHHQLVGNMMISPRAHPVSSSGLNRQLPMLPYRQDSAQMPNASSHQLRTPPFSEFCDFNERQ